MPTIIGWTSLNNRRSAFKRKVVRQRVWKGLNVIVAVTTLLNVSAVGSFLAPQVASAGGGGGSIKTTTGSCGTPINQNHYSVGNHIIIHAEGFDPGDYAWTIKGKPGGASGDPGSVVASRTQTVISGNPDFCIDAYTVAGDDWGEYQVKFAGSKGDNYRVEGATVGSLVFTKTVNGGASLSDDFSFNISPDPNSVSPISTTNGTYTFEGLPADLYTISEVGGPNGYSSSLTCVSVPVVVGQQASCQINNARDTQDITIVKNVVGGSSLPSDWTFVLTATGQDQGGPYIGIHSGDVVTVPTGTYMLSEDGPSGYSNMTNLSGNCYNVGGPHLFTNSDGTNTCTVTNTFNPSAPSLHIAKTVDHANAQPGDTLTFSVTVNNTGDSTAFGVQVDDTLPSFIGSPTAINPSANTAIAGHIIWNNLTVLGHGSVVLSYQAVVNSTMPVGTTVLHNVVTLGCSPFVTVDALVSLVQQCQYSGTAFADTSVTVAPTVVIQSVPSLSITKSNSVATFTNPGTTVTYTVVVSNAASATGTATNVVMNDVLPSGFTFTGGASTKTFTLGNIAPGASVTTTYMVGISASQAAGTFTNTATADGDNTSPVSATSKVEVRVPTVLSASVSPNLSITKTVSQTEATPSQVVTYTVTIKNTGDGAAANVVVTDELPVGFTYVDGGGSTKTWTFASLAAGVEQVMAYDVRVGSDVTTGNYVNRAFVLADGVDPVSAQATVTVRAPQVLGLATTGAGARDYATFGLGIIMLALGFIGLRKLRLDPVPHKE